MRIGFFDSGLGGLLVMNHCIQELPEHSYVYLGDTTNLPYGPKSNEEILKHITPCIRYLLEEELCNHVVVACNTASVKAVPMFLEKYPEYKDRIHGISNPTQEYLNEKKFSGLLTLATERTVDSGVYLKTLSKPVTQVAMPGLVELIEQGNKDAALTMCSDVFLYHTNISNVLLGCTHYIWLREDLQKMNPGMNIFDQGQIVSNYLREITQNNKQAIGDRSYYVTGSPETYSKRYGVEFIRITPQATEDMI